MATPIAELYSECAVEPVDRFFKKMMRIRYKKRCWLQKKIISKTLDEIMNYATDLWLETYQTHLEFAMTECHNQKILQKLVQEKMKRKMKKKDKKNEKER